MSDVLYEGAEAIVRGKRIDPFRERPKCEHRGRFSVDSLGAAINDEKGEVDGREVRVRVRCTDCGVPMVIDLDRIRRPREGEAHGVVLVLEPME